VRKSIEKELNRDEIRKGLIRYTEKAFLTIPEIEKPRILDIGCGTGVPTMELARLSSGSITAVDIDRHSLDILDEKISAAGLGHRVSTMECNAKDLDFPDSSFDIIWSEGSIFTLGFETGLKTWHSMIRDAGFMAVHDELADKNKKISLVRSCGYRLLDYFELGQDVWWDEYYSHLEKRVRKLMVKYSNDPGAAKILRQDREELTMFSRNPERFCSIFFIMQKT